MINPTILGPLGCAYLLSEENGDRVISSMVHINMWVGFGQVGN